MGKKSKIKREHLVGYFGQERLKLNKNVIETEMTRFKKIIPEWKALIEISFLSPEMKENYIHLVENRSKRLW